MKIRYLRSGKLRGRCTKPLAPSGGCAQNTYGRGIKDEGNVEKRRIKTAPI